MITNNKKLNELINELTDLLTPVQEIVNKKYDLPKWPVGIIIGSPRSGSTVFLQFLASTGCFSYPTNLLTRFAYAPYLGALIQKMLFDQTYDQQGDFIDLHSHLSFESELGKSRGALATNEFYHFWRKYLMKSVPEPFSDNELTSINTKEINQALASIEAAFKKPFCTKGMLLQFNLDYFSPKQPYSFYFRIIRDPFYICQSLWHARDKYFEDRSQWYSVKPHEYSWLKEMDIYHQIAGQVYFTEKAISEGLKHVPEDSQLTISYESFCENPEEIYCQIVKKYSDLGYKLPRNYFGPKLFKKSNKISLHKKDEKKLRAAYEYFRLV